MAGAGAGVDALVIGVVNHYPCAAFALQGQIVFAAQEQQLAIVAILDADGRGGISGDCLHYVVNSALHCAEIRRAVVVHRDITGRRRGSFGSETPTGRFAQTDKLAAIKGCTSHHSFGNRHVIAGVVGQLAVVRGDGQGIAANTEWAGFDYAVAALPAKAQGVGVIAQGDGVHHRVVAGFVNANPPAATQGGRRIKGDRQAGIHMGAGLIHRRIDTATQVVGLAGLYKLRRNGGIDHMGFARIGAAGQGDTGTAAAHRGKAHLIARNTHLHYPGITRLGGEGISFSGTVFGRDSQRRRQIACFSHVGGSAGRYRELHRFDIGIAHFDVVDFKRLVGGVKANQTGRAEAGIGAANHRRTVEVDHNRTAFELNAQGVPGAIAATGGALFNRGVVAGKNVVGKDPAHHFAYRHAGASGGGLHVKAGAVPIVGILRARDHIQLLVTGSAVIARANARLHVIVATGYTGKSGRFDQRQYPTGTAGGVAQHLVAVLGEQIEATYRAGNRQQVPVGRGFGGEVIAKIHIGTAVHGDGRLGGGC